MKLTIAMKNIRNTILALLVFSLSVPLHSIAQTSSAPGPQYEVNKVMPYLSISKDRLQKAQTLLDLNWRYKPSWVREYLSVEVVTTQQGVQKKAVGKSDKLSQQQKEIMSLADAGSDIKVLVYYIPENTLKQNDPKVHDFTFTVDPVLDASYPGGEQALNKYLAEKAITKIPEGSFKDLDLTAVQFSITEQGEVVDAHIFGEEYGSSKDAKTNSLLLAAIKSMPRWQPAEYANGSKARQDFVLTVGNMDNCVVHMLNIQKD